MALIIGTMPTLVVSGLVRIIGAIRVIRGSAPMSTHQPNGQPLFRRVFSLKMGLMGVTDLAGMVIMDA